MQVRCGPPRGPRGAVGADAEDAAVRYLVQLGWLILARNVRVGRDEVDIVALEPGSVASVVVVEVRSRSGPGFGSALENVDARKVTRLYRAAMTLRRSGAVAPRARGRSVPWRVDLLALSRAGERGWSIQGHIKGLEPA